MCSDFLFLCNPVLIGYIFLRIYLSLLGHPICWHTGVHSSLIILISWTSVVMFPLLFLILIIWVFSFFLNLAKDLSTLMFKKETLFHWFFFSSCFSSLYFIYPCSNLYYFLPPASFGFSFFFGFLRNYVSLQFLCLNQDPKTGSI